MLWVFDRTAPISQDGCIEITPKLHQMRFSSPKCTRNAFAAGALPRILSVVVYSTSPHP